MNLKVTGKRSFAVGENCFDRALWQSFEFGLYDVHYPNPTPGQETKKDHILMSWGHDENYPQNQSMLFCIPFPGFAIIAEQERPPIKQQTASAGIDGDVLLKAIAIAQDPKLALELLT